MISTSLQVTAEISPEREKRLFQQGMRIKGGRQREHKDRVGRNLWVIAQAGNEYEREAIVPQSSKIVGDLIKLL